MRNLVAEMEVMREHLGGISMGVNVNGNGNGCVAGKGLDGRV